MPDFVGLEPILTAFSFSERIPLFGDFAFSLSSTAQRKEGQREENHTLYLLAGRRSPRFLLDSLAVVVW